MCWRKVGERTLLCCGLLGVRNLHMVEDTGISS